MTGKRRGGLKFVLIHHGRCAGGGFHYRIDEQGRRHAQLDEAERGQHPRSIGIVVAGDFDLGAPSAVQLNALKALLLELKLRYPQWQLGAHRQVRGASPTTCPGRRFPMPALREWADTELLQQRDAAHRRAFEEQYTKI